MALAFTFTVFLISFVFTNGEIPENFTRNLVGSSRTFFVDKSSQTGFSKIQQAIDAVPSNNNNWITIFIKSGVYNEKVTIPYDKKFIYLKGEGMEATSLVWGDHNTMIDSVTFTSLADNIVASGITFVNSYNYPPNKNVNPVKQALAARISGDKSAFYKCGFLGYQDTLFDDKGRHFFKLCTVEGAVDFIFGAGQSIYENCNIVVNIGMINPDYTGFITAQSRENPNHANGFVFKECNVSGTGKVFLGRVYRRYSRVIFYNSFLSNIIVPLGWDIMSLAGPKNQFTFAEIGCQGPGSNMTNRVKCQRNIGFKEFESFTRINYIDEEGWLRALPLIML